MPKTKLNIIKPFLAVNNLPDGDVLHRLISVHDLARVLARTHYDNAMKRACFRASSASAICRAIIRASSSGIAPCLIRSASVGPSTNSITR